MLQLGGFYILVWILSQTNRHLGSALLLSVQMLRRASLDRSAAKRIRNRRDKAW